MRSARIARADALPHSHALGVPGAADHQVKLRGFRVEPGEIEAALARAPGGARGAWRWSREPRRGDPRLVAYVVPAERRRARRRRRCARRSRRDAPRATWSPAAFVVLDALPLTPNGKVDRARAPRARRAAPAGGAYVAPRTPTRGGAGRHLGRAAGRASAWARRDDFFALGGHSLLATRVVSRVRAALGVELPLRARVRGADAGRARRAGGRRRARGRRRRRTPPIAPRAARPDAPALVRAGAALVRGALAPESAAYNMPVGAAAARRAGRGGARAARWTRSCAATSRCAPPSAAATAAPCR